MKRVLLGSMPVGGGHHALRDSFLATLQASDPLGQTFEPVIFSSADKRVSTFYSTIITHVPWLQGMLFELSRVPWGVRLAVLVNSPLYEEAEAVLQESRPDVVVSTHFLLSMMFARARRKLGMQIPVVSAIPDYGEATLAFYPDAPDLRADYTIVMDRLTERQLLYRRHHAPGRLLLGGFIPRAEFREVSSRFVSDGRLPEPQRLELIESLKKDHPQFRNFDPSKQTLIFLGGSAWTEKTMPVLEQILRNPAFCETVNVIVVSGKNEIFQRALHNRVARNPRFSVFGFVSPLLMAQLQAISDFPVLGSLAPASMHELLEMRCGPLMLYHFIPGTENPHVNHIRDQQIGVYEPDAARMLDVLMQATGFKSATPELAGLLQTFPQRARTIRGDHVERASELPSFLARVGRVVPLRTTVPAPSTAAARLRLSSRPHAG